MPGREPIRRGREMLVQFGPGSEVVNSQAASLSLSFETSKENEERMPRDSMTATSWTPFSMDRQTRRRAAIDSFPRYPPSTFFFSCSSLVYSLPPMCRRLLGAVENGVLFQPIDRFLFG